MVLRGCVLFAGCVLLFGRAWAGPPELPKSLDDLRALEDRVRAVVAKVSSATVGVRVGSNSGSGVIVSEDGLVLTAGHVVGKPGQEVVFLFADGKTAKGKTLGLYGNADAGMMRITDEGKWPYLPRGQSRDLHVGTWCLALGHPLGYVKDRPPVVRLGRILRLSDNVIQTDCALVGGDSGGPLFDLEGRIIGIHSRIGMAMDINIHVPIDVFVDNWERLLKGEQWQDSVPARECDEIKSLFSGLVAEARQATVRVRCDGQDKALGTIVGPDGWILTKASEISGKVVCRLADGRELEAKVVGVSQAFDLAMLKVDAVDLPSAQWSKQSPQVGQWLAAAGMADDPVSVGVLSVPPRRIPPSSGVLGISLKTDVSGPPQIEKVFPNSPAEKAGLKENDFVTHIDGKPLSAAAELIEAVRSRRMGENVRLNVRRGDQVLAVPVKLGQIETPGTQRRDVQNRSGVGISRRNDDFPVVLQYDIVMRPIDCGGPVVDLSGKVVALNIARGGRTETYGIPTAVLLEQMYDLMSGRLNPDKLAAEKAAAEKAALEKAEQEKQALEKRLAEEKAAREKAEKEKAEKEKAEKEKAEKEKQQAEQAQREAAEKAAREKAEKEKAEKEKAEKEKAEKEKAEKEKQQAEQAQREAAEKAAREKAEKEKAEKEKAEKEKAEREQAEKEKAEKEQAEKEKAEKEKQPAEQAPAEKQSARPSSAWWAFGPSQPGTQPPLPSLVG